MEIYHETRIADKRVCTCWKPYKAEMTNLAFKHLDMTDPKVVEAMKNWIMNCESCPGAGDRLYDLLWLSANKSMQANKYFAYDNTPKFWELWTGVVLLRRIGSYPAYTKFDTAEFDADTLEIVFSKFPNSPNDILRVALEMW